MFGTCTFGSDVRESGSIIEKKEREREREREREGETVHFPHR
jgi:hypothetical protein